MSEIDERLDKLRGKTEKSKPKGSDESSSTKLPENEYLRVGTNFYRKVNKTDRWGFSHEELKIWTRQAIIDDFGASFIQRIPKYSDFTMFPDNINYKQVIGTCFNRYSSPIHEPKKGKWNHTENFLKHIFGSQFHLGIRYLQALYMNPERALPILCLVSTDRQTGKTTFVNFLSMLFGPNMAIIGSSDLARDFNQFALKNLICIEEAFVEKQLSIDKLKSYSTAKHVTVNEKFITPYLLPFYGKFVITSNSENQFIRIDRQEIRFFVRKIQKPEKYNHNLESLLKNEIPAFLFYLQSLERIDFSVDRTGFTPDELENDSLQNVKETSRPQLYHEMVELFTDYFSNTFEDGKPVEECYCIPDDILKKWFLNDRNVSRNYIKKILKEEFGLENSGESIYYRPFNGDGLVPKNGRPFKIIRSRFITDNSDKQANN